MTKELTQLDRARRIAAWALKTPADDVVIIRGDNLLDFIAMAEEFTRLQDDADRRAEVNRDNGRKSKGRPPLKKPSKATLAKRESRKRQKAAG
jgi:hypothetical protein